jgi:nucleoside-diphosphate-sugar epimerase
MVYGPGQIDLTKLVPYVTLKTLAGEPPEITSGIRMIDWIYVDDAADALVHMMNAPGIDGQSIDIGSGKAISVKEIVVSIINLINPSISPKFGAVPDRPMEQEKVADIDATNRALGWKASTDLKTGLKKTIRYYSNHMSSPN